MECQLIKLNVSEVPLKTLVEPFLIKFKEETYKQIRIPKELIDLLIENKD